MATDTTQETLPATNQAVEVAPGTRPCLTPKTEAQTAPGVLSPALSRPLFPDTPPASDERRAQGPNPAQNLHVVQNPAHQPKPDEDMVVESSAPQHDPPEPAQQPAQDHAQSPESQCRPDHSPDPSTNPLGSNPAQNPSPDPSPNSPLTPNPARNSSPNPAENPGQNPALNPDQKPAASSAPPAVEQLLDDLVSDPPKWSALNWAVNNDRGLLYALEEAVKARGASALRARLEPERARIDADAVWAMNQPLLSVVHFIVTGENDIRKKVVRVKDLKRIICSEMGLGAPSKAALEGRVRGEASTPGQEEMGPTKDGRPERRERKKRKSSKQEDGTDPATVAETPSRKLKRVRKPAKRSGGTDSAERNGSGRNGTGETEPDGKTLHQLVAERQKRSKEGRFSAGMRSAGMGSDGMRPEEAAWVLAGAAEQRNKGGGRGRKRIALGVLQDGARAQGTVHTGDGEQEAIEALVYSLRARAHKRGRRHVLDPDDREGLDSENAGQGDEMAGEVGGGKEVKEAKERCMWAIMDLLDVLPPELDLNAVEVFKELGATKAFDDSLGYLASKARARARKEWGALNCAAEDARATELGAIAKRRAVGERLGIEVAAALHASDMKEHNTVYSAFQVRLIELRREMERHVTLLEAREGVAKRAWLAYEEAASQSGEGPRPLKLLAGEYPL